MAYVIAHQGGWDEILLVAVPLIVLTLLLLLASSRAKRVAESADVSPTSDRGSESNV